MGLHGKSVNKSRSFFREGAVALWLLILFVTLLVPLPAYCLDLGLAVQFFLAFWLLLLSLHVKQAQELSSFPSLLLFCTLFRLVFNIAASRMILSKGEGGKILYAFGESVIQGNLLVGAVIFILLTIVNFIVITKGAGRVAEVAARFNLDGLPGRQLSIESELSSGFLKPDEAQKRREALREETAFYGAMDGASKFVRGDAIAALLITGVNLIGGLVIGVLNAAELEEGVLGYIRLAIGEGLAAQIPSLLVSLAAGVMVTRVSEQELAASFSKQLLQKPRLLFWTAAAMFFLGLLPQMPGRTFFFLAGVACVAGFFKKQALKKEELAAPTLSVEKEVKSQGGFSSLELVVGPYFLKRLQRLKEGIQQIRQEVEAEWGVLIPQMVIRDDLTLEERTIQLKLKGREILKEKTTSTSQALEAVKNRLLDNLSLFISRQSIKERLEKERLNDAALVEEVLTHPHIMGHLTKVVRDLVKEGVPTRDFTLILESVAHHFTHTTSQDLDQLVEEVRQALVKDIYDRFFKEATVMHAILFDPRVEQMLQAAIHRDSTGGKLLLRPLTARKIVDSLQEISKKAEEQGITHYFCLTHPQARRSVKLLIEREFPRLSVFSFAEVPRQLTVKPLATIADEVLI